MFLSLNFNSCLPTRRANETQDINQAYPRISLTQGEDTFEYQQKPKQPKQSRFSKFSQYFSNIFKKNLIQQTWGNCQIKPECVTFKELKRYRNSNFDTEMVEKCIELSSSLKEEDPNTDVKMPNFSIEQLVYFCDQQYSAQEINLLNTILNKFSKDDKETKLKDLAADELKTLISLANHHALSKDIQSLYGIDNFNKNFQNAFWQKRVISKSNDKEFTYYENLGRSVVVNNLSRILAKKTKFNLKELPPQTKTALDTFSVEKISPILSTLELPSGEEQSSIFKLEYTFEDLKNDINADPQLGTQQKKQILAQLENTVQSLLFNKPKGLSDETIPASINAKINKYLSADNVKSSDNKEIPNEIKEIFKAIPALITTIGRKQAGHSFTVDTHIIAVAQAVISNNAFNALNNKDKKLALLAALMHDITKMDGGQDLFHPITSAKYAYNMLKKAGFEDDSCKLVMNLIYCHHFGKTISEQNDDEITTLAYECSTVNSENFMQMLQILGEADIKGNPAINQNYGTKCQEAIEKLEVKKAEIIETLNKLKEELALTPFPELSKCTQLEQTEMIDGINVINFSNNPNLSNIKLLVHAINSKESIQGIENLTSEYKSDAILSTSDITLDDVQLFAGYECGFVINSENTTILKKYTQNAYTGIKKTRDMSGKFINQKDNTDMTTTTFQNSEVLITDFNVNAIFITAKKYNAYKGGEKEEILTELIKFAQKHNIPLVVIPDLKQK